MQDPNRELRLGEACRVRVRTTNEENQQSSTPHSDTNLIEFYSVVCNKYDFVDIRPNESQDFRAFPLKTKSHHCTDDSCEGWICSINQDHATAYNYIAAIQRNFSEKYLITFMLHFSKDKQLHQANLARHLFVQNPRPGNIESLQVNNNVVWSERVSSYLAALWILQLLQFRVVKV